MKYTESYFTTGNYSQYLHRDKKHALTCKDVSSILKQHYTESSDISILDYGCALGWLVKGLHLEGYPHAIGYDISSWALSKAEESGIPITRSLISNVDCLVALDVFEHISDEDLINDLSLTSPKCIIARIPCALPGEDDYALEVSRRDVTHINCKDKEGWISFFFSLGYQCTLITYDTIYDSDGVLCGVFIK